MLTWLLYIGQYVQSVQIYSHEGIVAIVCIAYLIPYNKYVSFVSTERIVVLVAVTVHNCEDKNQRFLTSLSISSLDSSCLVTVQVCQLVIQACTSSD